MVVGHELLVKKIIRACVGGGGQHGYVLSGKKNIGKMTIAREVACELLSTSAENLDKNADFCVVERLVDEKTGKHKKDISIEQARFVKQKLQSKSWSGGFQIVVINEAEHLNHEASNALLKALEEPAIKSIVFLLVEDDGVLLPTILSRLQVLRVLPVSESILYKLLFDMNVPKDKATDVVRASWGRPGRTFHFLHNNEALEVYNRERNKFYELLGKPFYVKLKNIQSMFGGSEKTIDHIKQRESISELLELWEMEWRDVILNHLTEPTYSCYSEEKIISFMDRLSEVRKLLSQNIHPRLLVEQCVLSF
jgi:DNA polymerase-3 subunit delta'